MRLPESLDKQARELAKRDGISINQLSATALAKKMAREPEPGDEL
ncbi:MAG: hypothetical protein ACT4PJ_14505 [Gemmatimonadaceae bacterium]